MVGCIATVGPYGKTISNIPSHAKHATSPLPLAHIKPLPAYGKWSPKYATLPPTRTPVVKTSHAESRGRHLKGAAAFHAYPHALFVARLPGESIGADLLANSAWGRGLAAAIVAAMCRKRLKRHGPQRHGEDKMRMK